MGGTPKGFVWLAVTNDEYEMPVFFADSAQLLGEIMGMRENRIAKAKQNKGCVRRGNQWLKIVKVKIETDE